MFLLMLLLAACAHLSTSSLNLATPIGASSSVMLKTMGGRPVSVLIVAVKEAAWADTRRAAARAICFSMLEG